MIGSYHRSERISLFLPASGLPWLHARGAKDWQLRLTHTACSCPLLPPPEASSGEGVRAAIRAIRAWHFDSLSNENILNLIRMAPELTNLNSHGRLAGSRMRIDQEFRVVACGRTKMFERTHPSKIEHFGDERCRVEVHVAPKRGGNNSRLVHKKTRLGFHQAGSILKSGVFLRSV